MVKVKSAFPLRAHIKIGVHLSSVGDVDIVYKYRITREKRLGMVVTLD